MQPQDARSIKIDLARFRQGLGRCKNRSRNAFESRLGLKYSTAVLDADEGGGVSEKTAELVSTLSGQDAERNEAPMFVGAPVTRKGWGTPRRIALSAALAFTMASMHQVAENCKSAAQPVAHIMTSRLLRTFAAFVLGTILLAGLLAGNTQARAQANEPASPYGGTVAEDIIARVNDQIITQSDYNRALAELDQEGRQHSESMQEISTAHKDLLRNLIDQQLWLSKGKELNITGETELVKRLDEIRKQYNLETIEDLEKAAREQGVSFEDFKANIRNQIITQEVMRQEVGEHIQMTPGEVERYYEEHKQDYAQPESERLSEILIPPAAGRRSRQSGCGQGQGRRYRSPATRRRRLCATGAQLQRRPDGVGGRRPGPIQARPAGQAARG